MIILHLMIQLIRVLGTKNSILKFFKKDYNKYVKINKGGNIK